MITVFTAVYNRAYIIRQLYQSLLSQTNYDFEWLIIDDGSEDEISEMVCQWMSEKKAPFKIRFYQQKNGGKHRAINRGVQLAEGDAFFIVDSDDYLESNAVEAIKMWWKDIKEDDSFAGISGLKAVYNKDIVGGAPSVDGYVDATNMERERYNLQGDKAEVYKTQILKRYPFPEFDGENFLTEAVVWDRIAYDGLKIRWFNKVIYICEYREDGLTRKGLDIFVKNPIGWGAYIRQTCEFYCLAEKERQRLYWTYFMELKDVLSLGELQGNLGLTETEINWIYDTYQEYIENTIKKIGKRIAIYGLGARGQMVLKLYRHSSVEISFVMDRQKINVPYNQIGIEDSYPEADAIIITPKDGQDKILTELRKRTKVKLLGFDEWKACIALEI